jgi:hypothetical protein
LQCRKGSFGPLCGSCKLGYTYKGEHNRCVTCHKVSVLGVTTIGFFSLIALVLLTYRTLPLEKMPNLIVGIVNVLYSIESGSLKVIRNHIYIHITLFAFMFVHLNYVYTFIYIFIYIYNV